MPYVPFTEVSYDDFRKAKIHISINPFLSFQNSSGRSLLHWAKGAPTVSDWEREKSCCDIDSILYIYVLIVSVHNRYSYGLES